MEPNSLGEQFESELAKHQVHDTAYRRRKLLIYMVRTSIAVALYFYFWKYALVRFSLYLYLPLNLLGLLSIFGWNIFLNQKIKRLREKIKQAEEIAENSEL